MPGLILQASPPSMPHDATPQRRAVVLLSGGLDSTVTAAVAKQEGFALYLLTIAYRQRHAVEIEQAKQVAAAFGVQNHLVVDDFNASLPASFSKLTVWNKMSQACAES